MQSQPERRESIVAPQALFTMNAPFVIDQAIAITETPRFGACETDDDRTAMLVEVILQRTPAAAEVARIARFVEVQRQFFETPRPSAPLNSPWPLVAQSLMMGNEFQYVD